MIWLPTMTASVFERMENLLKEHAITFQVLRHEPVYTSEEAARIRGTWPRTEMPNKSERSSRRWTSLKSDERSSFRISAGSWWITICKCPKEGSHSMSYRSPYRLIGSMLLESRAHHGET